MKVRQPSTISPISPSQICCYRGLPYRGLLLEVSVLTELRRDQPYALNMVNVMFSMYAFA